LYHNSNDNNTTVGSFAFYNNNADADNIASGAGSGGNITDGSENIDIGNARSLTIPTPSASERA